MKGEAMSKPKSEVWWCIKGPDGKLDPYSIRPTRWEAKNELSCIVGESIVRIRVTEIEEKQ
jgi:hypothetical protein